MDHKPHSLKKVLLLGSGGLRISQAGEFDYSGSQAIKALKEEGIKVVLINPNIATIQTDPDMADEVYLQPLNLETVSQIIEKEQPDAIMLSFGGQTALNLGLALEQSGILSKHNVKVLGTSTHAIRLSEDRALFKAELDSIEVKTAKSFGVTTVEEALKAAKQVGYPLMMRSGFSLGGLGSGIIQSEEELKTRAQATLSVAPQILIEENLIGWSEFEYEIVRDIAGNVLTVCNMENLDPMGIHTGESIVVSPSQSLDNHEYHFLREIAIKVANHFKIIGECNIQYAYNLKTKEYRVIEINPRLSRSSALASKATGYPLAFVAAKLALGYKLYDLKNSVTKKTCAYFEPALDYIVVKIPRWDTHKFKGAERRIGTEMKSVGEVMAVGRSFPEALQKAIGMLNIGATGLADYPFPIENLQDEIQHATDRRIFALYQFFKQGGSIQEANKLSHIDPWFLHHIEAIAQLEQRLAQEELSPELMRLAKKTGFSDRIIAKLKNKSEQEIRAVRLQWNIRPVVKQIDTLAGEFDAQTNYLYMTYHGSENDIKPSHNPAVIVLGSGPYSIGSSVEFDWSGVTTSRTLKKLGESPIIINSNPETVSTDYDESDRLYFEQLTLERVQDIADFENVKGIIVSVGGQIANNLVNPLAKAGYPILGTSPDNINTAENRETFSSLLNELGISQPQWTVAGSLDKAKAFAEKVGYPVLIRPSFVLSGAAMNVVYSDDEMQKYLEQATLVSPDHPVVISQFITEAKELEMDGVADKGHIEIYAISEHIENAGVHSGDATIVLPPQHLYLETIRRTKKITKKIVKALNITGPFNIQFIAKNNDIKVIECNLRASRSFPFVSKVTGYNFIEIATEVMLGKYSPKMYNTLDLDYVGVKAPQFSYSRLKGANPVAHVEMASTGEVACLGEDLLDAFYRSWQSTEQSVRRKKIFVSISDMKKPRLLEQLKKLDELGWEIYTTSGTHDFLVKNGISANCVFKASEGLEPNAKSLIINHEIDLIINIPQGNPSSTSVTDGFTLRRLAIDHHIPLITNLQIAQIMLQSLAKLHGKTLAAKPWARFVKPH
ncbi:MAG: carbamoyl phosphate synthase large subunit [Gammaproteobacteria bacterium]|jgi:carbamoyl-phosphate synthase large subunit|nr:carbamoyl phosphate synthase large subunit [Gammaproteobacteria bacterium]